MEPIRRQETEGSEVEPDDKPLHCSRLSGFSSIGHSVRLFALSFLYNKVHSVLSFLAPFLVDIMFFPSGRVGL